jgi:hypothetical protein
MLLQRINRQVKNSSPFIGWMYVYIIFGGFILLLIPKAYIHLFINQYHSSAADVFFTYATLLGDGISATILVVILLFISFRYASMVAFSNIACSVIIQSLTWFPVSKSIPSIAFHQVTAQRFLPPARSYV